MLPCLELNKSFKREVQSTFWSTSSFVAEFANTTYLYYDKKSAAPPVFRCVVASEEFRILSCGSGKLRTEEITELGLVAGQLQTCDHCFPRLPC